jgi:hypothetical protein
LTHYHTDKVILFCCQLFVAETDINKAVDMYVVNLAYLLVVTSDNVMVVFLVLFSFIVHFLSVDWFQMFTDNLKDIYWLENPNSLLEVNTLHYVKKWFSFCTTLQAGRSRVSFPIKSLDFSIGLTLPAALWPWDRLSL